MLVMRNNISRKTAEIFNSKYIIEQKSTSRNIYSTETQAQKSSFVSLEGIAQGELSG